MGFEKRKKEKHLNIKNPKVKVFCDSCTPETNVKHSDKAWLSLLIVLNQNLNLSTLSGIRQYAEEEEKVNQEKEGKLNLKE